MNSAESLLDSMPNFEAIIGEGTCGENVTWALDSDGLLTISGTGAMTDYNRSAAESKSPFDQNYDIKAVVIESGVTRIGSNAFYGCDRMVSVSIPATVTAIGSGAFQICSSINNVHLEDLAAWCSIQFGNDFSNPLSYTSKISLNGEMVSDLVIPAGVTSIKQYAFYKCKALTSVVIPDGVTLIDVCAFDGCTNLSTVEIPSSVTEIKVLAFEDCSGLTSVTLPGKLKSISGSSFEGCSSLTSIAIPNGVKTIGIDAFMGCTGLKAVTLPATVERINQRAFSSCSGITDVYYYGTEAEWNAVTKDSGNGYLTDATIHYNASPIIASGTCGENLTWTLNEIGLLTISGTGAMTDYNRSAAESKSPFDQNHDIKTVVIEPGVTKIGRYAFYGCSRIESVSIPATVTSIGSESFRNCTKMDTVYLEDLASWCSIRFGNDFSNPLSYTKKISLNGETVTDLVIPAGITSVNQYAFYHCKALTSVVIPDGVTLIDVCAFDGCTNLSTVEIPSSVTEIKVLAFEDCSGLTSVTLPGKLKSISGSSFEGCSSLTSIAIPNGVKTIGIDAFMGCTGLKEVTLPATVERMYERAFSSCRNITDVYYYGTEAEWNAITVDIGNGYLTDATIHYNASPIVASGTCGENLTWTLNEIGLLTISGTGAMTDYNRSAAESKSPFDQNYNVTAVVIEPGVTTIGSNAFYGCNRMVSVSIPATVTTIGSAAFYNCTKIDTVHLEDLASWCSIRFGNDTANPLSHTNKISLNGETVTDLVIPSGVTSIKKYAFYQCKAPTSVVIPDSVTKIDVAAFTGCTNLSSVEIPHSVTEISVRAFEDCTSLTSVELPCGLQSISSSLFEGCTGLTSIAIPSGVKTIGMYAFMGCTGLKEITLPTSVERFYTSAFASCTGITDVYYYGTEAEWNAITKDGGNSYLTGATIHYNALPLAASGTIGSNLTWTLDKDGLLVISGSGTMKNFVLTSDPPPWQGLNPIRQLVVLPGVTSIGKYAFQGLHDLTYVLLPTGLRTVAGFAFENCDGITKLTLPSSVRNLGNCAFRGCTALESMSLPNGVTSIPSQTFYGCTNLQSVQLPNQLKSIGESAFYLSGLLSIEFPETLTSIGGAAFGECSGLTEIKVTNEISYLGGSSLSRCNNLTSCDLPAIFYTTNATFSSDAKLTSIVVPDGATSLADYLFQYCTGLQTVSIPDSVQSIGRDVFIGCDQLQDIYYSGTQEQWNKITVGANNDPLGNATIHCMGVPEGLTILTQPAPFYGHPADTVSFTVEAAGEGLTYQWYFSDNNGETWGKSGSTGSTTSTLQPVLRANNSGRLFKCVITDAEGATVETEPAIMALLSGDVTIVNQPADYQGQYYSSAMFHVEAEGENLTYLWYYRNSDDEAWVQSWGTGYNTDTLTVTLLPYRDGRQFRCEIRSGGENPVYTETVVMALAKSEVTITEQPTDVTAKLMTLTQFHAAAEGENLTYRWYVKQGADAEWQQSYNDGYNTDTLNVRLYEYRDGYQYKCEIKSGGSNAVFTEPATLRMIAKTAAITQQPENVSTEANQTVTFTVGATGEDLSYQWQYRKSAADAWANTSMSGNQTDTLTVIAIAARSGYEFRCAVTDTSGAVTYSRSAALKVGTLPKIVSQPESWEGAVGGSAVFAVTAEGEGLTYQWYYKDASGTWTASGAADAKTAIFTVTAHAYRNGYEYRCAVTNAEGLTVFTDTVTLTVN